MVVLLPLLSRILDASGRESLSYEKTITAGIHVGSYNDTSELGKACGVQREIIEGYNKFSQEEEIDDGWNLIGVLLEEVAEELVTILVRGEGVMELDMHTDKMIVVRAPENVKGTESIRRIMDLGNTLASQQRPRIRQARVSLKLKTQGLIMSFRIQLYFNHQQSSSASPGALSAKEQLTEKETLKDGTLKISETRWHHSFNVVPQGLKANGQPFGTLTNMRLFEATVTLFLLTINLYVTSSQQHVRAEPVADVLFLVDGSQNMGLQGFKHTRALILKIVSKLKVGMDESRIGLAQYSDDQHVEFLFNTFQTKKDVLNYIKKKFQYKGGSSLKTGHALDLLHKTFFIASAGSRKNKGIPQIAIIITSAPSQDNVESYSTSLRNYGVIAISIGVKNSDLSELQKIAYLESPPFVFKMNTFVGFTGLTGNLTKTIQNIHEAVKLKEIELPTECTYPWLADIVFLVSESSRIGNSDFQNIRNFLVKVIAAMDVGAERIQIGLARYSNVTKADFFLNTFSNKTDIIKYLKEIIYSGGVTNTGAAIDFIRHNYFIERAGSRIEQGIPQIAIVITAEDSKDDVAAPAAELQRAGVNVYALGIKNVSYAELENIASSPPEHFAMTIRNLEDIERYILKKICIAIYSQFSETQSQDYITRGCIEAEDVDVFFLVEGSDAIKPADFNDAKNFIRAMVNLLNVGPNKVRIGVVQYASTPQTEISIDQYTSKSSLDIAIKNICVMGGDAKTGHALNYMKNVFNQAVHGRETKAQQVLVTIGVGNSLDNAKDPAADLRHNGIDIYAIGRNYSELLLIGGSRKRVFQISNFGTLKHFNKQAAQDLCSDKVCNNLDMTDIIFLIDGSTSINESNFNKIKQFVADLVDKIDIDGVQVGAVQFSTKPHLEFQLDKFTEKTELMKGIKSITRKTGDTYTGLALNFTADYFDQPKGGRPGVLKYLILITDGDAHDSVNEPAKVIRDRGITVLAIGIGIPPNSTTDILMNIGGSQDNIYNVNNFDNLEKILSKIVFKICKPTDCKRMEVADIIFVIDGSSSITAPLFDSMKDFMINLVNQSEVETDRVQFGAVLYDDNPQTKFQLDEFTSKTKIRDAIIGMELKGGDTYTARALNHAKKLLDSERGGRKLRGVPQFLIVITGGGARDKSNLPAEAEAIRDNDIDILAIGVNGAKEDELLKIGGWNDKWFYVQSFDGLKSLPKNISKTLCNKIKPACRKADIVFLIDGSESITDVQFDAIKEFLKEVVNLFAVSREEVQIGIAQFSKEQQTEIYLNESDSQTTLLGKIEKINQLKEGTYIGAALTFVKELFEPSAGSRKLDAVPQYLFLITDGDSRDPVGGPAKDLKQESIKIIAFNVGKLNAHQLRIITGDDENIVKVPDFNLIKVKRRVARDVCSDSSAGEVHALITVALEGALNVDDIPLVEFGRRFGYKQQLSIEMEDIGSALHRQIGKAGYPGEKGIDGYRGIDGIIGEQGNYGVPGAPGEKGNSGNPGRKGQKGDVGERGIPGLRGDRGESGINNNTRGPKGERGDLGLLGDPGEDGDPGKRGGAGNTGLHGHRGPPGKKGQKGKTGKRSRRGERGNRGPQGISGPSGSQGPKGELGARGWQGLPGSPGHKGIDGILGLTGQNGDPGNPGDKGVRGPSGPRGLTGMDGRDGFGPQGSKGKKGDGGSLGNPGQKGEDGKSGQSGEQGPQGMRGNRGSAGDPGDPGEPGEFGFLGLKGPRGPSGPPYRPCDLISMVRTNCPCCSQRRGECPAYPTELAFALDMSADVTPLIFERMKGIVINLLQNINIAENNCPIGARVAVLTYNNVARPFIRFSDFKKKQLLLKELEELAHERSTRRRNIGIGMQFVARNTFKRVRNGVLVKKIAVFITNGGSKDTNTIATAASQFSASGIIPVIISFKDIPEVERAFKVDTVKVVVLPSQQQDSEELLHRLLLCTLCFDKCEPYDLCLGDTQPSPLPVNLEIAFVVDDLQQMETAQSETVQHFLNSMLNTFLSSTEPKASDLHPRVALMQHTPSYTPRYGKDPFNLEFGILDYTTKTLKKRHIQDSFSQLEGSSGIGSTIEWSLKNFFLNATNQQGYHKVIFTIFSGEASIDEKKLLEISQEAKCKGFAIFTLVLGEVTNVTDLEEFVSFPFDQHLVHLDKALEVEMEYAQKFAVAFLKNLATGINSYPPPDLVKKCRGIKSQDTVKEAETKPSPDLELVVIMDDSEEPQSYTNNYDECALNQDEGDCNNYSIKWFFNNKEKGCARFWYGGCGGNKNRFDTQQECEALCLKPAP
ncbi:collagen alpha-6(VI) chain-like [Heptranchias perlo]|uniref:collagen alpha-6(VI) chain-like n=1 Tax=Heptranchias perlo TaxID=212740 RepID=UPI003559F28A